MVKKLVQNVNLEEFRKFYDNLFYDEKRVYEIHLLSGNFKESNEEMKKERVSKGQGEIYIEDGEVFKKQSNLYPDFCLFK